MGAVVEIWFESLIPFLLKDSLIVHWIVLVKLWWWWRFHWDVASGPGVWLGPSPDNKWLQTKLVSSNWASVWKLKYCLESNRIWKLNWVEKNSIYNLKLVSAAKTRRDRSVYICNMWWWTACRLKLRPCVLLCSCADQPRLQTLTDAGFRSRLQTQTALPTSSPQSARKLALSNFRHRPYIFYHSSYISICSSVIGFRLVDLFSEKI